MRRFCQLVFLRYPLANDDEAVAGRMRDLPEAVVMTVMRRLLWR